MLYVGFDWADDHHDICVMTEAEQPVATFRIEHSSEGFTQFQTKLAAAQPDPGQILIALETKHGLIVDELLRAGYQVYAINPKAVNRYKDRHVLTGAKSDQLDARAMADLLRTDRHRFQPLTLSPDDYRWLERLCSDVRKMVDEKTRVVNQLTACLKEYYPQAVRLVSKVESQITLAFLTAFPDPQTLLATSQADVVAFFKQHHYCRPDRVPAFFEQVHRPALHADPVVVIAARLRLRGLVEQLSVQMASLRRHEQEIQTILDRILAAQPWIDSLPGLGARLTPEVIVTLGPADAPTPPFDSPQSLAEFSGCVPVTRSSGKRKSVSIRRVCDRGLRRTFRDWAFASLLFSRWARAFYDYAAAHGQHQPTILRNLAFKWIKILIPLWRSGQPYNEDLHIQSLKRHQVPWAAAL